NHHAREFGARVRPCSVLSFPLGRGRHALRPLFPYTTLFRSAGCFIRTDVSRAAEVEAMVGCAVERFGRLDCAFNNAGTEGSVQTDRKSTRLNSSHVSISYAVFCLKKKMQTSSTATRPSSSHD